MAAETEATDAEEIDATDWRERREREGKAIETDARETLATEAIEECSRRFDELQKVPGVEVRCQKAKEDASKSKSRRLTKSRGCLARTRQSQSPVHSW